MAKVLVDIPDKKIDEVTKEELKKANAKITRLENKIKKLEAEKEDTKHQAERIRAYYSELRDLAERLKYDYDLFDWEI